MAVSVTPMFLAGGKGQVFALHFDPGQAPQSHIIFLPPFGEEMNRCRHLVSAQAMSFAERGHACMILDPFGTGDSEGELANATWEGWRADAVSALRWCQSRSTAPATLWGLRLGGMLALDLAASHPAEIARVLLWQPVTNGKTFLTQALRARIAYLANAELPPETTTEMREAMQRGETVEVAGYLLGGELAGAIDALNITALDSLSGLQISWLQQAASDAEGPSKAVQKAVEQLQGQGNTVDLVLFDTPQIWQLSERAECQELLDKTDSLEGF